METQFSDTILANSIKFTTVFYVEDTYNSELNTFIKSNFNQIFEFYSAKNIDFFYLPILLQSKDYQKVLNYNRPYLQTDIDDKTIQEIYFRIKSQLSEPLEGAGLVKFDTDGTSSYPLDRKRLEQTELLLQQIHQFANKISDERQKLIEEELNVPEWWNRKFQSDNNVSYSYEEECILLDVNQIVPELEPEICFQIISDADVKFEYDAFQLADEIRTRIQKLKETGSLFLIGDILDEIQGVSTKLSSITYSGAYPPTNSGRIRSA